MSETHANSTVAEPERRPETGGLVQIDSGGPAVRPTLENEISFRLLFTNSPLPMWINDASSKVILAANRAAAECLQRDEAELCRCRVSNLVAAVAVEPRPGCGLELNSVRQLRRRNGSPIDVELVANRIFFKGRPAELVLVNDVSARKLAEKAITDEAPLLNQIENAVVLVDSHDRISFWNRGAQKLYGWAASDALGRIHGELLEWDSRELNEARNVLRDLGKWGGDLRQKAKDSRDCHVSVRATKVADGSSESYLFVYTDISERRKLEAQFLRAQRLESIGTLASGIAHDLNNILSPILMSTGIIRKALAGGEYETFLNTIEVSAERGADIVRQVLTFARGVEGDRVLIQPRHLIKELANIMTQTFPKNIRVVQQLRKDLWTVQGDATQLHQLMLNLCVNARDAMTEGGTLTIVAENYVLADDAPEIHPDALKGSYVYLQIVDTGMGIPPEIIQKVFDPFFTTKGDGKGTGLGLSTVASIVKTHAGFITLESEVGKGTIFTIYLPASVGEPGMMEFLPNDTEPTTNAAIEGAGETVLVVDDEPSVRTAAARTLENHGYRVHMAEDGREALALYYQRREQIALIITDFDMEMMDGLALARAIKNFAAEAKIIVSSGQCPPQIRSQFNKVGIDRFLDKPYAPRQLIAAVSETLSGRTAQGS